jgi:ABC-type nitrate/sulfonate/bicarbonate transport system substrate-binding protein
MIKKLLASLILIATVGTSSATDRQIVISTSRSAGWSSVNLLPEWCKKFELDVKVVPVDSKMSVGAVRAAQARGEIDLIGSGVSAAIVAQASGFDSYIIANLSIGGTFLVVKDHVSSIEQLKGKKIAVLRNTGMEAMLLMSLDKKGITYDGNTPDVNIVNLPPSAAEAAYMIGEVDAFVGIFPENINPTTIAGN